MTQSSHHHHHHALCCLSSAPPQPDAPPTPAPEPAGPTATAAPGSVAVAGVLHKWTNYGRGWRERWFSLRDGVLSYSKIRSDAGGRAVEGGIAEDGEVRLIGGASARIAGDRRPEKPAGVVCLKVSAFRESKSDDRRFYIFSPTKTLHLKTDSKDDRVAWIEALILARSVYSLRSFSGRISFVQSDVLVSTARLRNRMRQEGLNESLIQDCEQIMLSEFSSYRKQLKIRYEDHLSLFGSSRHHFEEGKDGNIIQGALTRNGFTSSRHGNFSEYSTTESDDFEKQDGGDLTCEEESTFFDAADYFSESNSRSSTMSSSTDRGVNSATNIDNSGGQEIVDIQIQDSDNLLPEINRRSKLPEPTEKEKGISLWSIIKDSVGKDLTRVSHHPMLIACHSEGKGWKFWGDSNVKSKFWGQSIQVDPVGVLTLEFDDGEIFQWSKVTTTINNLILGKLYCNHHGTMHIKGNRQYSCKLKFKEPSLLDRNPRLVCFA
uniref:Uncharacterized protein n=2 Tax=Avena sativa TaxID=4498 RepID=A0ACD5ZV66_AVESA